MKINPDDFPSKYADYVFRVSYGETDMAGVAYYGEYMHWFERSRSHLIREFGMSYREVEERGIFMPVRRAECRYIKFSRYDEELAVRCAITKWGKASLTFGYQVWGPPERSTLLAVGETEHALLGPKGRPVRVPEWLRNLFSKE